MTEDRRREIALLLIEAIPFNGFTWFEPTNTSDIEDAKKTLSNIAEKIGVHVAELESIFRPGFDKVLNLMFPHNTCEVSYRRDTEAKRIAILFWNHISSYSIRKFSLHDVWPVEDFLRKVMDLARTAEISDKEIREWAESFFEPTAIPQES